MAISDFIKKKPLNVTSVSGSPIISRTQPFKIKSGDDSKTGTGEIVLDWSNIDSKSDIGVYDENDNLLDYYFESFDATAETATIHVYRDWVRDGSTQASVAYGDGPSDQSVASSEVFDKESDLAAGYLLNEASGDAIDVTSNNNDGTATSGITREITGQVGEGYSFDSDSEYVSVPDSSELSPTTGGVTISYWIRSRQDNVGNWSKLFDKGSFNKGAWATFIDRVNSSGYRFITTFTDASDNNNWIRPKVYSIPYREWHLHTATYDISTGTAKVYLDGVEEDSKTFGSETQLNFSGYNIHWTDGGSGGYIDGDIDHVRVHNEPLSADEITAEYDATKGSPTFFSQQRTSKIADINLSKIGDAKVSTFKIGKDTFIRDINSQSNIFSSNVTRILSVSRNTNSYSNTLTSNVTRIISLKESVSSFTSLKSSSSNRGGLNYGNRPIDSNSNKIISFTTNERTSLELIDYTVDWDGDKVVWYTPWVNEDKVLGSEDRFVLRASVVDDAKDPSAQIEIQYSENDDGQITDRSELIEIGHKETIHEVSDIPVSEDGAYRLQIGEYSGYNSLVSLDMGIVH